MKRLILSLYRTIAILAVALPISLNIIFQGDVITSILYVPLTSLLLSSMFIFLDKRLVELLTLFEKASSRSQGQINSRALNTNPLSLIPKCVFCHD